MSTLEARQIEKAFGRTHALRGLSATIEPGEIVAITGPSGSGKSTLLHCLSGMMRPETGEVRYAGERIDTLGEADRTRLRREHFGIVFQFRRLVPELTAVENVALPLLFDGHGREEATTVARGWLEEAGAADVTDARPEELSGGQLQRVGGGPRAGHGSEGHLRRRAGEHWTRSPASACCRCCSPPPASTVRRS
jgi:putative ABC transport system ATP-binding protein